MSLETDLRVHLLAASAITDIVAQRVYVGRRPMTAPLPALVYHRISSSREPDLSSAAGYCTARIQFDCHAADFIVAAALAEAIRQTLDGRGRHTLNNSTTVYAVRHAGEITAPETWDDGADRHAYQISADYLFLFEETIPSF